MKNFLISLLVVLTASACSVSRSVSHTTTLRDYVDSVATEYGVVPCDVHIEVQDETHTLRVYVDTSCVGTLSPALIHIANDVVSTCARPIACASSTSNDYVYTCWTTPTKYCYTRVTSVPQLGYYNRIEERGCLGGKGGLSAPPFPPEVREVHRARVPRLMY